MQKSVAEFHLYGVLEQAALSMMTEVRRVDICGAWHQLGRGVRKPRGLLEMFYSWVLVAGGT